MSWFPPGRSAGPKRGRRSLALVSAAATVVTLAACGDDSGGGGGGGGGSASGDCSAPGVTDDAIKVAIIAPFTGPSASSFAGFADAAEARIERFNSDGGVEGRTIEVVREDDMGDGQAQTTAARAAVQDEQVFGIIAASRIDTMYDYLNAQNVPVTGLMTPTAYSEDENVFGYAGGSNIGWANTNLAERLQADGATNIAVIGHNSPAAVASIAAFTEMADQVGLEVGVTVTDVPLGSFDATATAIQMKNAGIDSIFGATLADSSVSVIRALEAQGVELLAGNFFGLYDPVVSAQVSEDIQGITSSATGLRPLEVGGEGIDQYLADMEEYRPDVEPVGSFTSGGYVSADLFIRGLEEAGDCLSRDTFIEGLRGVEGYDGAGLTAPESITFDGGPNPNGSTPYNECEWYTTREGDEWVPDPEPICNELQQLDG
jgi:ABC-type branched-subunit amino acid transport system substrate-binding protein